MEITGKVIAVLPLQSGVSQRTGNPWAKQDYVVEIPGQYPRRVCFEVFGQDRISQFGIQMNEEITVSFDINASEYQGKWYNKISAWQVSRGGAQQQAQGAAPVAAAPAAAPVGNTTGTAAQQPSLFDQPDSAAPAQQNTEPQKEGGADGLPF